MHPTPCTQVPLCTRAVGQIALPALLLRQIAPLARLSGIAAAVRRAPGAAGVHRLPLRPPRSDDCGIFDVQNGYCGLGGCRTVALPSRNPASHCRTHTLTQPKMQRVI